MNDDIQQPEGQGINTSQIGKKTSKFAPSIALTVVGGIVIAAFVIGLAIAFSFIKWREPAPNTTALAKGLHCDSWDNAPVGYQSAIEKASNAFSVVGGKVPVQSALLGAVFLSEHGNSWPQKAITDTDWAQGGNGVGPFQIENFDNKWKTVSELGLTKKTYPKPSGATDDSTKYADPQNFDDAALAAGGVLYEIAHAANIPANTTNENEVKCLAAGYNGGSNMCKTWKNGGYNPSDPPHTTNKYEERAWTSFQNLNIGCQSYTAEGYLKILFLSQRDPEWGSTGGLFFPTSGSIAGGGCAATSAAMVINYLKNANIKPYEVAEKFYNTRPSGYNWAPFNASVITNYGIKSYGVISQDQVATELAKNHPIIMHLKGNSGHKTHYVVIKGIRGNKYITADPIMTTDVNVEYPIDRTQYTGMTLYSFGN